jgi:hypothetical protein
MVTKTKKHKETKDFKKDHDGNTNEIFAFTNAQNANKSWFLQTMMMMELL